MFLFKKKEVSEPKRFVVVLGTSPLAMFLVNILQQNNIEVVVFSSLIKNKKGKDAEYVFRNNVYSNNFSFNIVNSLSKKPEYCFLASSVDEYKNDLLALSDEAFRGVKVVNFSSFYNHELIEQMSNVKEIRAYFNGWLIKDKKEINLLNRNVEIKLCCKTEDLEDVCSLLNDKKMSVKQEKNTKKLFLQTLLPWFLGNLLVLSYQRDISALLLDNDIRQKVDILIKELSKLLGCKEKHVDEHSVLPDVYAFPNGFVSEFNSLREIMGLFEIIGKVDIFTSPNLFTLMAEVTKKY